MMVIRPRDIMVIAVMLGIISALRPLNAQTDAHGAPGRGAIRFVENRGQIVDSRGSVRSDILFSAGAGGVRVFLRRSGLSYVFSRRERDSSGLPFRHTSEPPSFPDVTLYRMDVDLAGADPSAIVTAEEPVEEYANFYLPHCPQGITGVRSYGRVIYHDIYPKIDLVLYAGERGLKYDFVVHPGGRPESIRLRYRGDESLALSDSGSLVSTNPLGRLEEGVPRSYQGPGRRPLMSRYRLADGTVSFGITGYDRRTTLVIDPTLDWATYLGGGGADFPGVFESYALRMVQDRSSQLVLAGTTVSTNFPASAGQLSNAGKTDVFVARFSDRGARRWVTYFGGSLEDAGYGVTIDPSNNVIVVGTTASRSDFPVTNGAFETSLNATDGGFVAKFDSAGRKSWCTFYGNAYLHAVAADSVGNILLGGAAKAGGMSTSGTFQTSFGGGVSDAFIAKFTPNGARVWATYCGGSSAEDIMAIAVGQKGGIAVTGWTSTPTTGSNFPTSPGAYQTAPRAHAATTYDGFVLRLDSAGTRRWCTYLGGTQLTWPENIAIDGRNHVIITGMTQSSDFPVTTGAFQTTAGGGADGFVTRLDTGGRCVWSTLYGGNQDDAFIGLAVDENNKICLVGYSSSVNFPLSVDAFQYCPSISNAVSVAVTFDSTGKRNWSTVFGSCNVLSGALATAYRVGMFAIAGAVDVGGGMPTSSSSFQSSVAGGNDIYIEKLCDPTLPHIEHNGPLVLCDGDSTVLTAISDLVPSWVTTTGMISPSVNARSIVVRASGKYWFTVTRLNCIAPSDTVQVIVNPRPRPVISANGPLAFCLGDSITLDAGVGYKKYLWSTGDTTQTILVKRTGIYSVTVTSFLDCSGTSLGVQVVALPRPAATISASGPLTICDGDGLQLTAGPSGCNYLWSTGATTQSITVKQSGSYSVTATNAVGCAGTSREVKVKINPKPDARIIPLSSTEFCAGDSVVLRSSAIYPKYRWSTGDTTRSVTVRTTGSYLLTVIDSVGCSATSVALLVRVFDRPKPKITADGPLRFCTGDSVILSVGDQFASYVWSTGFGSSKILVKEPGRYSVTVTNDIGCPTASDTVVVQVDPRPRVAINGPSSVCANGTATYSVKSAPRTRFLWSISGGGTITGDPTSSTVTIRWGASGTGTVRLHAAFDSSDCGVDSIMTVSVGTGLVPTITAGRSLKLCDGDSVTLDAGVYASYRWSTGATTRTITVRQPGSYTVTATDADGCSGTSQPAAVSINQPPHPEITASRGTTLCAGDSTVLDAGAGYAKYLWSNGYTTRTLTARSTGTYSVTVTDDAGCTGTSGPVAITVDQAPVVDIHGPKLVCRGSTVGYGADPGGSSYAWTVTGGAVVSGDGTSGIVVRWGSGPNGTVALVERTASGCQATADVTVTIGDQLEPVIGANGPTDLCEGASVRLDAGAGYASYRWSTGATTQTIDVSTTGTYTVTVEDANGCTGASQPVAVTVHPLPRITTEPEGEITLCEGDSVTLKGVAQGEVAGWLWSTGETTQSITVKKSGGYSLTATSPYGCASTARTVTVGTLPVPSKPVISVSGDTLVSSEADRYQWNVDGVPAVQGTSRRFVATGPGSYTVTVGAGNCTATSDPWVRVGEPVCWGDTVSAVVGDRLLLPLRLAPALAAQQGVTGYHVTLKIPPRGLFPHRVIDGRDGGPIRITYQADGTLSIERHGLTGAASGDQLLALDLEGLSTAEPLNPVVVLSVELEGLGQIPVAGPGLVILSGCDVGRDVGFGRRVGIRSVQPNPVRDEMTIVYRAPKGSMPTAHLIDLSGRELLGRRLPAGTGEDQTASLRIGPIASGVYRLEVRDGAERSAMPVIIEK